MWGIARAALKASAGALGPAGPVGPIPITEAIPTNSKAADPAKPTQKERGRRSTFAAPIPDDSPGSPAR